MVSKPDTTKTPAKPDTTKTPAKPDTTKTPAKPDTIVSVNRTKMLVSVASSEMGVSYFLYDDSNRLVTQKDSSLINGSLTITTCLYTYDSHGKLVKREQSDRFGDTTYNITYQNDMPVSTTFQIKIPNYSQNGIIQYTVANGKVTMLDFKNITYNIHYIYHVNYNGKNINQISMFRGSGTDTLASIKYTYGGDASPFYTSKFNWLLFVDNVSLTESLFYSFLPFSPDMYNEYDIISSSYSEQGSATANQKYTITTNTLGYPTQVTKGSFIINYQYIKAK